MTDEPELLDIMASVDIKNEDMDKKIVYDEASFSFIIKKKATTH